MGNKGRPMSATAQLAHSQLGKIRAAQSAFGVTSSGQVKRMSHGRRKKVHRGYRMPSIVKQQIEHNMRFQDQLIIALMAGSMRGGH